jgi:hypothetical protein
VYTRLDLVIDGISISQVFRHDLCGH